LLEVPKIEFDFNNYFDFNLDVKNHFKSFSDSLPGLPALPTLPALPKVPEVNISLNSLKKLEVYEYLLKSLQNLILIFQTISFFSININSVSLTTQINSTISNFYTFVAQVMEIINFSNKKSWDELKTVVNDIRKKFSSLSCAIPTNIQIRELADGRLRIYFLCAQSKYDTLLYVDVNSTTSSETQL
jgi:hypothetical protein